jgi:hypothetical protein
MQDMELAAVAVVVAGDGGEGGDVDSGEAQ